ncbi:MAG: hypothetical protein NT076_01415 [Candidatus Pacearchaeota archaeon]|nr:hypothetical protein [Candidatus Pacearchaeota archaeon]
MEQKQESELKERIAGLRASYERLRWLSNCRVSKKTIESYSQQIEQLQAQLNN